jgi:hypothetical protein
LLPDFNLKPKVLRSFQYLYKARCPLCPLSRLQAKAGHNEVHAKTLSIDNEMVILGSLNFGPSSWSSSPWNINQWYLDHIIDLAEYVVAVDDQPVTREYNNYFNDMWNNGGWSNLILADSSRLNSLQDIIAQAQPYDIVVLPPGIYRESVTVDKPLQIIGTNGQKTIIEPPDGQPAFEITSSDVSLYHLIIHGSTDYGIKLTDSSPHSLKNVVVRKVLFKNNASGGILIEGLISGSPVDYVIENNTFIGGQYGVRVNMLEDQSTTSTIRNNIFYGQTEVPIKIDSTTDGGVEYKYNLFNHCVRATNDGCPADWYAGTLGSASSEHHNLLNVDPEFTNPASEDYTLLPDSPMVNAGDPTTVNEMGFDGRVPQRADIGAFETELFIELPDHVFEEVNGQAVVETEHFMMQISGSERSWQARANLDDYVGSGYLSALPDTDLQFTIADISSSPGLNYAINFSTPGTYTVWIRGYAANGAGDSVYVGLDGDAVTTLTGFTPRIWSWANKSIQNTPVTLEITQPGLHTIQIWQREDGLHLDRLLLTTVTGYLPTENGPPENNRFSE